MEASVIILEKELHVELNTDELTGCRTEYGCNSVAQVGLGSVNFSTSSRNISLNCGTLREDIYSTHGPLIIGSL